jgi:hypothetical protein
MLTSSTCGSFSFFAATVAIRHLTALSRRTTQKLLAARGCVIKQDERTVWAGMFTRSVPMVG